MALYAAEREGGAQADLFPLSGGTKESSVKISVIVPIYKVEPYLRQCVESVLEQSHRDLELILVDDGSPDACPRICDEYAARDKRVSVIHKENGGLSSARNAGIRIASGDYVLFVDSDDWLSRADALALLSQRTAQTRADVISFAYCKVEENGKAEEYGQRTSCLTQESSMPLTCVSKEEQLRYLSERGLYIASACNKLIRLDCIRSKALFFALGQTSEDVVWCMRLMMAADSLDFFREELYCYRQRAGSISQTLSLAKCVQLADHIVECAELAEDAKPRHEAYYAYAAYQFATFIKVQTFAEAYPVESVQRLRRYAWLLRYHAGNKKLRALNAAAKLLGYPGLCRLLYAAAPSRRRRGKT